MEVCGGICGTAHLEAGTLEYKPFVGVAFNIAGTTSYSSDYLADADLADASAWGGICITYTSDLPATLELGFGAYKDVLLEYDNPFVTLAKASVPDERCFEWSAFKQAGWGRGDKITGEEAGAELATIKFKIQAADGTTGSFNITKVSSVNDTPAIKAQAAASAVKASLSGRTLSFAGIKSVATAEVMNLQGQVMLKGTVSSSASLDLSSIDAGVYMVRVAGKSVDFSQKIILK